jgi:N-succinyldiaminopimelate aminotransferase
LNPFLDSLQPYPFERLRTLVRGIEPASAYPPIAMSIGEPRHASPACVREALLANLDGLSSYPPTAGGPAIRAAIATWVAGRYRLDGIDPDSQVLPVNGSKEAIFSIAHALVAPANGQDRPCVLMPNPCYQVYEGAAILSGAEPRYYLQPASDGFRPDWGAVPEAVWRRTQLVYVCSPGNPTGSVLRRDDWIELFDLADRHGFAIASDECYSEIHFDDANPPEGALGAARAAGRHDWRNLLVFSSLSKRSSVPGLRSGFVAGDARLIERFRLYRTYSGGAMSATVQAASVAAWQDEVHVAENRALYRAKFDAVLPILSPVLPVTRPEGGFFLWAAVPGGDDQAFARDLFAQYNVLVLPGSFLGRSVEGVNPGAGFVRMALVAGLDACSEAATRIREFLSQSPPAPQPPPR